MVAFFGVDPDELSYESEEETVEEADVTEETAADTAEAEDTDPNPTEEEAEA